MVFVFILFPGAWQCFVVVGFVFVLLALLHVSHSRFARFLVLFLLNLL